MQIPGGLLKADIGGLKIVKKQNDPLKGEHGTMVATLTFEA